MDSGPEVEAHVHAHTGHRWLDIILGVCAVVISMISAVLAFQHGHAMERMVQQNERMVQASTWPYITIGEANGDASGQSLFKIVVSNSGVGPAKIEWLQLSYGGQATPDIFALTRVVAAQAGHTERVRVQASDTGGVIPARQAVELLVVKAPVSPPWLIDAYQTSSRQLVDVQLCYCSIFGECWRTSMQNPPREPIAQKACHAPKGVTRESPQPAEPALSQDSQAD